MRALLQHADPNPTITPTPTGLLTPRVLMVALTGMCVFLNVYAPQPLLPLFTGVFHASKSMASMTIGATTLAICISAPWVGLLAERIGRKYTMAASVAALTVPTLLAATAPGLKSLIAWRFAQGLCMPGIIAVTLAYVSEEWAGSGAASVMAAYVAGTVLGGVTGRFVSAVVAAHWGWRAAFVVLGCLNGLGAAAVWRWLPHSKHFRPAAGVSAALADMRRHLDRPQLVATFAIGGLILFALVATFTYVGWYLAAPPFRLGTAALGFVFLVYLVGVVITPIGGQWIERIGHRTSLIASVVITATGALFTLVPSVWAVVAGLALTSTGVFLSQASAASYLGHVAGRAKASAAGLYSTFYYLGGTCGANVPARVWDVGGWKACVGLTVLMLVAAGLLAAVFWREPPHVTA